MLLIDADICTVHVHVCEGTYMADINSRLPLQDNIRNIPCPHVVHKVEAAQILFP